MLNDCSVLKIFVQDLKREFITELIYPAVQANCIYEVPSPEAHPH